VRPGLRRHRCLVFVASRSGGGFTGGSRRGPRFSGGVGSRCIAFVRARLPWRAKQHALASAAAAAKTAPMAKAIWYPPLSAPSESAPSASSLSVRAAASWRGPRGRAPRHHERGVDDSGGEAGLALGHVAHGGEQHGVHGHAAADAEQRHAGSTWRTKLPSTGDSAKSASPAAVSARPAASGTRMPKRITILAESPAKTPP